MTERSADEQPDEGRPHQARRDKGSTARRDDKPVLSDTTRDEQPGGWGDPDESTYSDDWYRRERPPHHG